MITQPEDYASVLDDIREVLANGNVAVRVTEAGWPLSIPTRILRMAGTFAVRGLLTERPMALASDQIEAVLHLAWNLAFLAFGAVLVVSGWVLTRPTPHPRVTARTGSVEGA